MKLTRRSAAVLGIAAGLLCLLLGGVIWRAEQALRGSERDVSAGKFIPVSVGVLKAQPNPGFEAVSTPATFQSAASFAGRFYLSGPTGLFAYSADGILEHVYRVGMDLPPAPLGRLAVGTLADSRAPELLIATDGAGVLAFDGRSFRQIQSSDGLSRKITTLLPLPSGRLLLGTEKRGVLVYDGKTLQSFHPATKDVFVTALAGSEAELWVGTLDRGVLHWRGGQVETLGEAQGLPDARVEAIAIGPTAVYVGTAEGVGEVRDSKVTRVLAGGQYAHALLADSEVLYVGEMEGSVRRVSIQAASIQTSARRRITAPSETSGEGRQDETAPIAQLLRVGDAKYAVQGDQLLRLESGGEWRRVLGGTDAFLTDRNISSLMVASDGRMWVGYFDRGLDVIPATGGKPAHVENDAVFCVNRIIEDPRQSSVAVGTANGLVLFDRNGHEKQLLTRESGLIANHVTDVALVSNGVVAGTPAGITFLDASGAHSMYAFQGLVNNHVYALGARGDTLLVGTLGGISLVSGGTVRRNLNTGNSALKANWITALTTSGGDWYAGTYGSGVFRIDGDGTVSPTEAAAQGTVINPGAMLSEGDRVLAGTLGKGLLVSDAGGMRWRTITAGLPSLNVTALAINHGVVYIGTDNGLVKIAEDKL